MIAVSNYFESVSNGNVIFEFEMTDSILTANNQMSYYAGNDFYLGRFETISADK